MSSTSNVNVFKRIVFNIPGFRAVVAAITLLGVVYSGLMYLGLGAFTSITLTPWLVPLIAVFVFILPTLLSGESSYRLLPDYPRRWGYFLALSMQFIIFVYSMILTGADTLLSAWNILWLGLITIYAASFMVLLATVGYSHIRRIAEASLVQPLAILVSFHVFLGEFLNIPLEIYLTNLAVLVFAGIIILLLFVLLDYLLKSNVSSVSVIQLISALIQKRPEALDVGYPSRPWVQTFVVQNSSGEVTFAAPWVHPGPLEGFGGGNLTANIISELNRRGKGFFLHVPSSHKSDPADPEDYRKIIDALSMPEKTSKASKLIKKKYGDVTFYGRRFNGQNIVFIDQQELDADDFETEIFTDGFDLEKTMFVDMHNHEQGSIEQGEIWNGTVKAEKLRTDLQDFLDRLEKLDTYRYSAGFDASTEGVFALVEEVENQKTLVLGVEGNGVGDELREVAAEQQGFDEVLLLSTDTHSSIHDLSDDTQAPIETVRDTVETAGEVSPASLGFASSRTAEMNLLREDYSGLVFSVNIIVRLLPLALLFLYIALVIWVF